ncbi:MAG: hypothetical protein HFK00_08355 [Oscillospiraceae bacterium]|nr:hypothetical protein [Oscillospiraceae bacterium]
MKIDVAEAWKSLEDIWLPIAAVIFAVLIFVILIRCICKIQRTKASVTLAFTVIIIAGGLLYFRPHKIIDIKYSDVSRISVSHIEVTDSETIKKIIDDINGSEYKRTLPSLIECKNGITVNIYDKNDNLKYSFELTGNDMVNTGKFWEQRNNGKYDLDLYQNIIDSSKEE